MKAHHEIRRVAIHEAGHVLGCRIVGCPCEKATIVPQVRNRGHVEHSRIVGFELGALICLLARAAEIEFGFDDDGGHRTDYEQAAKHLKEMLRYQKDEKWSLEHGYKKARLSHWSISGNRGVDVKSWRKAVRVSKGEVQPEFDRLRRKARRLARKHRNYIEKIAQLLIEKQTLTDEDIPQL